MKIAILSDIHSNKYALEETFKFLENHQIDRYFFLGDFFGYYPWAADTYELLKGKFLDSTCIIGNHDKLIITNKPPEKLPEYWGVIEQNRKDLSIEAIEWLKSLKTEAIVLVDNLEFKLYHGTPDDPINGRFYPDNKIELTWFPKENQIILLGHTHYPLIKKIGQNSFIINPGSIGQSRDGNIDASFSVFDTETKKTNFYRIPYSVQAVINKLEKIDWYPRAIKSLQKKIIK